MFFNVILDYAPLDSEKESQLRHILLKHKSLNLDQIHNFISVQIYGWKKGKINIKSYVENCNSNINTSNR